MYAGFFYYTGACLSIAFIAWLGIAAAYTGLKRLGKSRKIPLGVIFIGLWILYTSIYSFFGQKAMDLLSMISLVVFVFGSLFWITSLLSSREKNKKGVEQPEKKHSA